MATTVRSIAFSNRPERLPASVTSDERWCSLSLAIRAAALDTDHLTHSVPARRHFRPPNERRQLSRRIRRKCRVPLHVVSPSSPS